MSVTFYNWLHIVGLIMVVSALSASIVIGTVGKDKLSSQAKLAGLLHGIGMLVILVAGFGMMAKMKIGFDSVWIIAKMVLWLVIGAALTLSYRKVMNPVLLRFVFIGLFAFAAYLGIYKPQ